MSKPIIHFSHANGFPASTYRKFFENLIPDYEVGYIDTIGHDPNYPIQDNWPGLVDELIQYIEKHYDEPVHGVGHSLGGVLTFLAAAQSPQLFKSIVLIDAPVYGWFKCAGINMAKKLKFIDKVTPGGNTRMRRNQWASGDMVRQHFQSKKLFKYFDDECLNDYVAHGMLHLDNSVKLKFKREIEYQIYSTLPHHLYRFRQPLKVPFGFMYGERSDVIKPRDVVHLKKRYQALVKSVPGTHLFPFEHPIEAAKVLDELLRELKRGEARC